MQAYTINPDGSGKVVLETITPGRNPFAPPDQAQKPEDMVKQAIQERISGGEGIEAWSDITCKVTPEGKVHFKGTAYFADINKLKAGGGGAGGGGGELSWTKQGDAMVLAMKNDKNDGGEAPALTDAQVEEKLQQEKQQYQQMKPMMAAMFEGLKFEVSARLPGKIAEANIFTQKDNVATMSINGKQMSAAMDKINSDDAILRKKIKGGKAAEDDIMFEQMFGKKGPAQVKVTGANAPLFDYKAEVEKAKAAEAAMFKNLGVNAPAK